MNAFHSRLQPAVHCNVWPFSYAALAASHQREMQRASRLLERRLWGMELELDSLQRLNAELAAENNSLRSQLRAALDAPRVEDVNPPVLENVPVEQVLEWIVIDDDT